MLSFGKPPVRVTITARHGPVCSRPGQVDVTLSIEVGNAIVRERCLGWPPFAPEGLSRLFGSGIGGIGC